MRDSEIESHLPLVRREALRWSHLLEAEDLEAEGALGLVRAARRFDPARGVPFRAFAIPFVRWQILEALRRRTRRNRLEGGGFAELVSIEFVEPVAPDRDLAAVVDLRDRLRLVATLPEGERHALIRTEVDGLSAAEVALELGVSVNRVHGLTSDAAKRLRRRAA